MTDREKRSIEPRVIGPREIGPRVIGPQEIGPREIGSREIGQKQAVDQMWALEAQHWNAGWQRIAGIDEAGRGAWAGPVTVAAVILPTDRLERPYRDSKTLSPARRERLAEEIKLEAFAWTIEFAPASEVDEFGVLEATKRASLRAIARLEPSPDALVTDYLRLVTDLPLLAPAKADSNSYSVAAASILAKTARDAIMVAMDLEHPGYGFARHKGYGAQAHAQALEELGVCDQHRRSFAPIRRALETQPRLFEPDV